MRRLRRPVVQLTSLLDLLFMMVFISLLQTKKITTPPVPVVAKTSKKEVATPTPVKKGKIALEAIFHFHATSKNPNLPSGKYEMEGTFDQENGKLQLGGLLWLERPKGYDMVPLKGVIDQGQNLFTGNIEFPNCNEFTLKRSSQSGSTPISGKWEGSYVCSQGETGLTLTIR